MLLALWNLREPIGPGLICGWAWAGGCARRAEPGQLAFHVIPTSAATTLNANGVSVYFPPVHRALGGLARRATLGVESKTNLGTCFAHSALASRENNVTCDLAPPANLRLASEMSVSGWASECDVLRSTLASRSCERVCLGEDARCSLFAVARRVGKLLARVKRRSREESPFCLDGTGVEAERPKQAGLSFGAAWKMELGLNGSLP